MRNCLTHCPEASSWESLCCGSNPSSDDITDNWDDEPSRRLFVMDTASTQINKQEVISDIGRWVTSWITAEYNKFKYKSDNLYLLSECVLVELRSRLLLLYKQQVLGQKREANTHQSDSKTHIFVCSLGYIPGKYLMFFPGEMHESVEHAFYISQPTREIAVVPWFRTCSVMASMYWLEH